jgi:hypothetical protein
VLLATARNNLLLDAVCGRLATVQRCSALQAKTVYFHMEAVISLLSSVPRCEVDALLRGGLLSDSKTCTLMAQVLSVALSTLQVRV